KNFGTDLTCTHCQHIFRLSQFIRVPCPHCQTDVRLRPEHVDELVTCKFCTRSFIVRARDVGAPAGARGLQPAGAAQDVPGRAQVQMDNAHGGSPVEIPASSQLFVRLKEARPEAAEARREEQAIRKELEQARAEIERLRAQCAALEIKSAQAVRLANDLE